MCFRRSDGVVCQSLILGVQFCPKRHIFPISNMSHIFPNRRWIGLVRMRSRRLMTQLVPHAMVFALLATALAWQDVAPSVLGKVVDAGPNVQVRSHEVPAAFGDTTSTGDHVIAELAPRDVKPFSLIGVTWASGMPANGEILVKWRSAEGWSEWTDLHQQLVPAEDGPGRPGTESQWVDSADAIAVRVTSATSTSKPTDLRVATVTPGETPDATPMAASQPGIIMRAQWGARPQGNCADPFYGPATLGAVIHHSAGSNSYTAAESPAIVRAIQAFHMNSRGWCDIGYNFLVDQYGQIFEGRAGGIDRQVRGAHAGNEAVNEQTVGVSLMGTFESVAPSEAMKQATVQLVAWRFGLAGIPAEGTYAVGGLTLNRISGHRDVKSTACPGTQALAWLGAPGGLRAAVANAGAFNGTPTGVAPAKVTKKKLVVIWNPVAGAKKYRVQLAMDPSFTQRRMNAKTKAPVGKFSGLKRGRTYYVQVVALGKGGKPLGGWSAPVAIAV